LKVLVDADACPVVREIIHTCHPMERKVVLVMTIAHHLSSPPPGVEVIEVDSAPQAVDMVIINRVEEGDVVVTGDYGLAALVLARGAHAISERGFIFQPHLMDNLLLVRHIGSKERRAGRWTGGPRLLSRTDRLRFVENLQGLLNQASPVGRKAVGSRNPASHGEQLT